MGGAGVPVPEMLGFGVEPIETGSSSAADAAAWWAWKAWKAAGVEAAAEKDTCAEVSGLLDEEAVNLDGSDDDPALWELVVECRGIQWDKIAEERKSDVVVKHYKTDKTMSLSWHLFTSRGMRSRSWKCI